MGRRGRATLNRTLLLLAILISMAALAPAVSAGPVNLFPVDDDHRTASSGTTTTFEWILYNNDSAPYVITPSAAADSEGDYEVTFDLSHITLYPGDSKPIAMMVTTESRMPSALLTFEVSFNVTQMNALDNTFTLTDQVQLEVVPVFGAKAGDNKILGLWDNELPPPLDGNWGAFLVSVGIWTAIALFIIMIADPLLHRFTSRTSTTLDDLVLRIIRKPFILLVALYGAVSSLEILSLDRGLIADIEMLYQVALILIMAWLTYKIYVGVIIYYGHKLSSKTDSEVDDVLVPVLEKLGAIVIPTVAIMFIFSIFGYNLTVILAGLGFMGIVIGMAAQATLANFFAGLQMVVDRPFKIGDLLRLDNGDICEVRRIGMRSTTLYNTFTHELMVVPNNDIANKKVINMVLPDRRLKIAVGVGVAYGSDVELVMGLMKEAALSLPDTLKDEDHQPIIRFTDFADSSLNFTAFIWITDLDKQFKAASEYRTELLKRFEQHGIEIPFPQSVVWLKDLEGQASQKP
ncbi:MAG: mechanosensitive ion channel family protein [Methanomassiliicoccales archaeon]|nr:mechanosensitive ion channel family protein [Methanomassiliicoccales archaeon]